MAVRRGVMAPNCRAAAASSIVRLTKPKGCNWREVEAAQAERDVAGFLNEMRSVGLVEVAPALAMAGD